MDAPYIKEFHFILECNLLQVIEIGSHTQFIGKIIDVKVDESVIGEDGHPDIERVKPILFAPESRSYYGVGRYLGKAFSIGINFKNQ